MAIVANFNHCRVSTEGSFGSDHGLVSVLIMPPSWTEQWWPVAYLRDLDRLRPQRFTLLERDLVLWWDRHAACWRAFDDVCPHRLVPLSEGRINDAGLLECPYHGWSFDGSGSCSTIPQMGGDADPAGRRSSCRSLPTATGQGLLFVWTGDPLAADQNPLPLVPVLQEDGDGWADGWIVQDTFRDLPMDALTLLENVLDVSHVPFTHHRTVGRRENAGPVEAVITREDLSGFEAFWEEGPRRGALGSQATCFRAPQLMWHDLTAKGFARILTVVYAVPIRRGQCRLFARFPFQFKGAFPKLLVGLRPRWLQHIGNHKVLEDDQVFLHWQERVLEAAGGSKAAQRAFYLPTASDRYVAALHRWVTASGGEPFEGQTLPPRQELEGLMDRYHSHTRHCRSCSRAFHRLHSLRPWLWGLLWLSAVLMGLGQWGPVTAAGLVLALFSGLALRQTARWQRGLWAGDGQAPRNHG